jgi:hypothetical protein
MDVDRIQKINDLAVELQNQGLAPDRQAAVAQAEKILLKKEYACLQSSNEEQVKEIKVEEKEPEKMLGQEEIKEILEKNVTFIVKTMKGFKEEISKLKEEIKVLKSRPAQTIVQQPRPQQQTQPAKQQNNDPANDHPRSGNYNDTDVSIETFFYSGSRSQT